MIAVLLPMLAIPDAILAAETSTLAGEKSLSGEKSLPDEKSLAKEKNLSDESSESACNSIKTALHALAAAEHDEAFALDLAAEGGSSVIVEARLSAVLDRGGTRAEGGAHRARAAAGRRGELRKREMQEKEIS